MSEDKNTLENAEEFIERGNEVAKKMVIGGFSLALVGVIILLLLSMI